MEDEDAAAEDDASCSLLGSSFPEKAPSWTMSWAVVELNLDLCVMLLFWGEMRGVGVQGGPYSSDRCCQPSDLNSETATSDIPLSPASSPWPRSVPSRCARPACVHSCSRA